MTKPVRLQLSRRKGYSLQAATIAANGLPAVIVARPGPWGNPFRVSATRSAAESVAEFRLMMNHALAATNEVMGDRLKTLRGKNLACWCKPGDPCHADVLLELANPSEIRGKSARLIICDEVGL